MDTSHASNQTKNGGSWNPGADSKPVAGERSPISSRKPRRVIVPESLRRSMDDLLARTWPPLRRVMMHAQLRMPLFPRVALAPSEDHLDVDVELPGVEPTDLEVAVQGSTLTVRGARHQQREIQTKDFYRLERSRRVFERSIPLERRVEPTRVTATLKHGVLHVRLAKGDADNDASHRSQGPLQIPVRAE